MAEELTKGEAFFVKTIGEVAKYAGKELPPFVLQVYADTVRPHGFEKALETLKGLLADLKPGGHFFSANELLEAMGVTPESEESKAIAAANRAIQGVSRWGSQVSTEGCDRVKAWLGEASWAVVNEFAHGWNAFCATCDETDPGQFRAQVRQTAVSTLERAKKGTLGKPVELPPAEDQPKGLVGAVVAQLCESSSKIEISPANKNAVASKQENNTETADW